MCLSIVLIFRVLNISHSRRQCRVSLRSVASLLTERILSSTSSQVQARSPLTALWHQLYRNHFVEGLSHRRLWRQVEYVRVYTQCLITQNLFYTAQPTISIKVISAFCNRWGSILLRCVLIKIWITTPTTARVATEGVAAHLERVAADLIATAALATN